MGAIGIFGLTAVFGGILAVILLSAGPTLAEFIARVTSVPGAPSWLVNLLNGDYWSNSNNAIGRMWGGLLNMAVATQGWITAAPYAFNWLLTATGNTLWNHWYWIHWVNWYNIPAAESRADWYSWGLYQSAVNTAYVLYYNALSWAQYYYQTAVNTTIFYFNVSMQWIVYYYQIGLQNLYNAYYNLRAWMNYYYQLNIQFTDTWGQFNVNYTTSMVTAEHNWAAAEIQSLALEELTNFDYITQNFVPTQLAQTVKTLNDNAASAVRLPWLRLAATTDYDLAQLAINHPNVLWAADIINPVPPTDIASAIGRTTSTVTFCADWVLAEGLQLHDNLDKFGQDLAELDGVITTVILGALTAGAVAFPDQVATVLADVVGDPLNTIGTALVDLVGSL